MGRTASAILIAASVVLPPTAEASSSRPEVRSLFPHRAEVFVGSPGLSRLPLPPEILAECQPELSDLRIVDLAGREVPYLIDGGPPPAAVFEESIVFEPAILSASRRTEERDSVPDLRREVYHLSLPEGEPRRWGLVIESGRSRFVRRLRVTAVEDGEEEVLIEEGSLFRLQAPLREKLEATLPMFVADSVVVTLEGEEEFFLEPVFRFVASRILPEHEQVLVDLAVLKSLSHAGRTVVELDRPRGLVPDQLAVATATGSFNRRFEVWDRGPGSTQASLAADTLYRLEGVADVERTRLPLAAARGNRLRVVIDDGDSPPLEELAFQAVLRRPSLVFSLPVTGSEVAAGHLLYGGARAFRPRYDLAGLLAADRRQLAGAEARVDIELRDSARLTLARLGPPSPNPLWDPTPALAFAMRPGTKIATWPFEYRRPLSVPETGEGLLRLALDAETVARCRPDLADVRLVDSESRQWPYLLNRVGSSERVPLAVASLETDGGTSTYELALPAGALQVEELLLDGPAPYFDRPFELVGTAPGRGNRELTLARGRLTRRPEDPGEVVVSVGRGRLATLELRIQDGDDPPQEWTSVEARVPLPEIFFAAPQGDYTLLFGDPDARRPRYELEQVSDLVLAVDSTTVEPGDPVENPGRGAFSRFRGEGGWQQVLLWSALVLAALVLAWITLRLARQGPGPA